MFGKYCWPGFVITTFVTPRDSFPFGSVTFPIIGYPPAPNPLLHPSTNESKGGSLNPNPPSLIATPII